jgi:hypothetical protein
MSTAVTSNNQEISITLDVDWAPDVMIDFVAGKLYANNVCATWFVTHISPAIARLRQYPDLFELGIHPNFQPGSTHGDDPEAVLRHCMELVPEATSIRTHGLVQSTQLLEKIMHLTPIKRDVSLFLPHTPHLRPVEYRWRGKTLIRIPFFWEDDFEMEQESPCWRLAPLLALGNGLKVFNFHPCHIYLNSADLRAYQGLKQCLLSHLTSAEAAPFIQEGAGTQGLFTEIVEYLKITGSSQVIRDIAEHWVS